MRNSRESGGALGSVLVFLLLVGVVAIGVAFTFGKVVPAGYIGVRQITLGPAKGFSENGLRPGFHWNIPVYSRVHLIPQNIQQLHLNRDQNRFPESSGALEIQTTDGAIVDVDVTVLSRFFAQPAENHGGPADLIKNIGASEKSWRNHIRRVADDELRRSLGVLPTGKFYDPHLREEQVAAAQKRLNERIADDGIYIDALLVRRYTYRAERINEAIFKKNLQDQEKRLNTTASELSEAQAELEKEAASWDAKIKTLQIEGENQSHVIRSEGDLYESEKVAAADLLVAKATAEVDRLRANALNASLGADVYVARELAPLLGSLKGGVVGNIDPYNLNQWMERLGVDKAGRRR